VCDIRLEKLNEVFMRVYAEPYVLQELRTYLTFKVPGHKFMPLYKNKMWDGTKCLVNKGNTIYLGLLDTVKTFAKRADYSLEIDEKLEKNVNLSEEKLKEFIDLVTPQGTKLSIRDYQFDAIYTSIVNQRQINLACTGAGKSAIIYYLIRWYIGLNKKVLIIVPSVSLVEQLFSDFKDYAMGTWNVDKHVQKVYSGFTKNVEKGVVLSTWQSVYKLNKEYLNQFYVGIFDEAHLCSANSITEMMEKMTDVPVKLGTTGTLDEKNQKVHILALTGLIGKTRTIAKSKELIERGMLSPIKINMLTLKYPEEDRLTVKANKTYAKEMEFVVLHKKRNMLIRNLACSTTDVTLVMFQFVEKHGYELFKLIKEKVGDTRKVFFVHGGVDGEDREKIRHIVSSSKDSIIVASYGTMSTGTNIPGISNIIFASPYKSKYKVLQTIGRGLRTKDGKSECVLYDIVDDLKWKSKDNILLTHAAERIKIYSAEGFPYKMIEINL
jgi:superfamily II DNA or RNA helicase